MLPLFSDPRFSFVNRTFQLNIQVPQPNVIRTGVLRSFVCLHLYVRVLPPITKVLFFAPLPVYCLRISVCVFRVELVTYSKRNTSDVGRLHNPTPRQSECILRAAQTLQEAVQRGTLL